MDGDSTDRIKNRARFDLVRTLVYVSQTLVWLTLVSPAALAQSPTDLVSTPKASPAAMIDALPQIDTQSSSAVAQPPRTIEESLEHRGSVTFRKTTIPEVVFMLSELWKVNIVAGQEITGEVSGTFYDAPLREVLTAILSANNYGYRRTGNSLIVLPLDRIGSDDPNFTSETLIVAGGSSEELIEAAQLLLSSAGQLKTLGNNRVLVIDHPERIARVRSLLQSIATSAPTTTTLTNSQGDAATDDLNLPTPTIGSEAFNNGIAYFTPQFTEATPLVEALQSALGDTVTIAVFGAENRIMVLGSPEQLRLATDAIEHLDVPRAQVRIRAFIYDVALDDMAKLGVDWSHSLGSQTLGPDGLGRNAVAGTTGLVFTPVDAAANAFIGSSAVPLAGASEGSNFVIRSLNDTVGVSAFINALDTMSGARLLADPTITVADRTEASIKIVQKIPIANTSQLGGTTTAVTSVTFEEAGITLNVIPHISRDSTIQMQVKPVFSVLAGFQNGQPLIDSRTAETTVRVADRQTFVLGGLRQSAMTESVRGVPFLKDIKYVGKLFSSTSQTIRESELIVFLQPEIIDTFQPGTLREQHAYCVGNKELDRVPVAAMPVLPSQDKHKEICYPTHHGRERLNTGTSSLQFLGGTGLSDSAIASELIIDGSHVRLGPLVHEVIVEDRSVTTQPVPTRTSGLPPVHVAPLPR